MQIAKSVDAIPVHEDAASRALLLPNPQIDQLSFNKGTMAFERWNGTAWVTVVASGEHIPTYADAATRDANIPVPTLDQKVVLSSTGEMQRWNGASWQTLVVGAQGPQGLLGPKGDKGDLGPQGPAGTAGAALTVQPTHAAFLAYSPSEGALVLDAERQLTNAYTAGQYRLLADRPWESVNPKSYGAKADGGASTITATDITNHPEWCDLYVAGDTWDFVGWQEGWFAAFALAGSRQEFTVQAGSTSTSIALSAGAVTANQYRGGSLWVVTGAGKMTGTPVRVTSHDTSHLVLASALGTVPSAGDKVMVIQWNGDGAAAQDRPFVVPGGNYGVNRTLFLQHVLGGVFMGAGRMVVSLTGLTKRIPIVVTNGMTFSDWSGIQFISGSGNWYDYDWSAGRTVNVGDWILPAMDGWLWQCTTAGVTGSTMPNFGDGNSGEAPVTDGTAVWTQKLRTPLFQANWDGSTEGWSSAMQGNTWRNCRFTAEGRGVPVGLSMAESGDGVMGSENTFFNCHWMWFSLAGYYSNGMNAFQNTHIGGNFSNCSKHAIFAARGAFYCYSIGFQNGWQSQYQNNGSDLRADNSAGDCSDVSMCRSESLIFARFGNDHRANIRGCYAHGAMGEWAPSTAYTVGAWVIGRQANGKADGRIYQCMVAGTSSATEPDWIAQIKNNNFTDGTVQWQLVEFTSVSGTVMMQLCAFAYGQLGILYGGSIKGCITTRSDAVKGMVQSGSPHVSALDIQGLHVYTNGNVAEASGNRRTSSPLGWTRAPVVSAATSGAASIRRRRDEPAYDFTELGSGGAIYFSTPTDSVGIRRGDTAVDFSGLSAETRRILAVVGKLGKMTPSLFELLSPDSGSNTLTYPTDTRGLDFHVVGGLSTGAKPGGRWIAETADAGPSGAVVNYPHPRLGIVGGGVVVAPGLGADPVYRDMARTITYDPPSIAANSVATVDVDFFGAVLGDAATAGFSLPLGGLLMFAAVQANDLVRVTLFNPTAGAIDLASGTLRVEVRSRQPVATGTGDIAQLITALGGNASHPRFYDTRVASSMTLSGSNVTALADARGAGFGSTLGQRGTATPPTWDAVRGVIQFVNGQGLTAATNDITLSGDNTIVLIAAVGESGPFGAQGVVGVGVQNETGIGIRNHQNGTNDYAHIAAVGGFGGNGTGVGALTTATVDTLRDSETLRLMFITVSGGNTLTLEVMDETATSASGTVTPGTGTYAFNLGSFDGGSQDGVFNMLFRAGWHATKAYTAQEKQLIRLWAMSRHNFHAAAK